MPDLSQYDLSISYHQFFGQAVAGDTKRTPLGIVYSANSLDRTLKVRRVEKGVNFLRKRGGQQHLINEFLNYAPQVASQIPRWLDTAFEETAAKGRKCGGKYAEMAAKIAPSDLRVIIRPCSFPVPEHGLIAAGMVNTDGVIHLSVLSIAGLKTNPAAAYFQRIDNLAGWEIGNYFWHHRMKIRVTGSPDTEIGNKSPCGG